jgi:hypothetical protein
MTVTGKQLARLFIHHIFKYFGMPHTFISDRDPRALSDFFEAFVKIMNVKHEFATARHQQTDGKCERMIRTFKNILKPYLNYSGTNWIGLLPLLEFNINNSRNSTGYTPFEIDGVRIPSEPGAPVSPEYLRVMRPVDRKDILELQEAIEYIGTLVRHRLEENQISQAKYYDRNKEAIRFQEGDTVMLNTSGLDIDVLHGRPAKLAPKWVGPFTVVRPGPHPDTYELDLLTTSFSSLYPVFHVDVLRPYYQPSTSPHRLVEERPPPVNVQGIPEYQPEEILAEKVVNRQRFYLVKWKGWDSRYNTWESRATLRQTSVLDAWLGRKH